MKIARYIIVILFLMPAWLGCSEKAARKAGQAATGIKDTIPHESQRVNFGKDHKNFCRDDGIVKAVSYSFLDIHDYEQDSSDRGQLLMIMPNYDQYLSTEDPHPKVLLSKIQTRKLLSIINDPGNYSYTAAFCYSPRNCFCFYNNRNEIVGWYEVCFECARIQSIPGFTLCRKGGLTDNGLNKLKQFCVSAGITVGQL